MFHRLRTYRVLTKAAAEGQPPEMELVPEGLSVMALLFSPLWALYHRLWAAAAVALFATLLIEVLSKTFGLSLELELWLSLSVGAVFGLVAHDIRVWTLLQRGFVLADIVIAEDETRASLRFLDATRP